MIGRSPEEVAAAHLAAGRPKEALAAIEPAARTPDASHTALARYASALKALERMEECLAVRRVAASRFPQSGVAWHNLASTLGDMGAAAESVEACRKAFAAGLDAPETWLIYARGLAAQALADDAFAALEQALRRRPGYGDALVEKAQLRLATTGDVDEAAAVFPDRHAHALTIAGLYRGFGRAERALEIVEDAAARSPGAVDLVRAVAGMALELGEDERAVRAAETALRLAPHDPVSMQTWAAACLATGRVEEALNIGRRLVATQPLSQSALALCAVAGRLAGAPDYGRLYDYGAFVRGFDIAAPAGWASVEAFLADLRTTLTGLHDGAGQPLHQSLRHGTQTREDLRVVDSPVVKAFFAAIDPLIRRYMAELGPGSDPLRVRNTGDYALAGCWSIRLRSEGYHVDHMHPEGWLSSAFYVEVPPEVGGADDKAGWLQFGRPSLRTSPTLEPAHFERPAPGRLVLFPSYMWHGTVPFTSAEPRTTIAFDVVPA